jgi:hypothetical protein
MQDERAMSLHVFGNNTDELEAVALKQARKIFSGGVPLVVDRSYKISKNTTDLVNAPADTCINTHVLIRVAPGVINPAFIKPVGRFESWWRRTFWVK